MKGELIVCHNDAQNTRSYYLVSYSARMIRRNRYFKTNEFYECIQLIRIAGKLWQYTSRSCCIGPVENIYTYIASLLRK